MSEKKTVEMTDSKPYLVRATYFWIADNGARPHIAVATGYPGVRIPPQFRNQPYLNLNISMTAAPNLNLGDNVEMTFNCRFGGKDFAVIVPYGAIASVYSPDAPMSGAGMSFAVTIPDNSQPTQVGDSTSKDPVLGSPKKQPEEQAPKPDGDKPRPGFLKVVK